jgi:sugar phosphate isomerase/epimerase
VRINQVAAQLYTVRDFIQTPEDIKTSLKKIRAIGYEAVQVSGMGPIPEEELLAIAKGEGLTICATHEPPQRLLDEPERVVERLDKLNCRYTAFPHPGPIRIDTLEDVRQLAKRLNAAGKVLFEAGKLLTYHNHHIEFRRYSGQLMLEIFYQESDPRYLQGEIDTYWVQYGGGDPVQWCKRLKARLPLLHLKDYRITEENKPTYAEIGSGNLDWKALLPAAEESGCEWFIVEQDTCPGDPFESLQKSFEFLKANFAK